MYVEDYGANCNIMLCFLDKGCIMVNSHRPMLGIDSTGRQNVKIDYENQLYVTVKSADLHPAREKGHHNGIDLYKSWRLLNS